MKTTAWWRLLVVFLLISCGPQLGTADLTVEFLDRAAVAAGRKSTVIVTATDEKGTIGSGSIHLASTAGSLMEGIDSELDAYGRTRVDFICDRTTDPSCGDGVKLTATWTRSGKAPVTTVLSISITSTGGAGSGAGSGGGDGTATGGTGGGSATGDLCSTECSNTPDAFFLETYQGGHVVNGWGPSATQLVSSTVSTASVKLIANSGAYTSECANGRCTRISLVAEQLTYPMAPPTLAYLLVTGTHPTASLMFGGSQDAPALNLETYTNAKRSPPVSYQAYFDPSFCGGFPNITTFTVCKLDVSGDTVNEVHVSFSALCYGTVNSVRGCAHFTK